jgi:hypothetical protein
MGTKARPVAATESGVVMATPGRRLRVAVAHRTVEILAEAAAGTRRLRMIGPG